MSCKGIDLSKRKVCIGDLKHKIKIDVRSLTAPNDIDYSQEFVSFVEVWAGIKTTKGAEIFDGVNTVGVSTHQFFIRYIDNVSTDNMIEYDSKKYRILRVQEMDESKDFILIQAAIRGDKSFEANLE